MTFKKFKVINASCVSKMDVQWGYNNIRIAEGDEWKAAFRTNRGLYEPYVLWTHQFPCYLSDIHECYFKGLNR